METNTNAVLVYGAWAAAESGRVVAAKATS
jgi:hypothetical protein